MAIPSSIAPTIAAATEGAVEIVECLVSGSEFTFRNVRNGHSTDCLALSYNAAG